MKLERKQQILVRRRAAIGDTIMSTGVVRELKRKYGDNADVHVATEFMEVYTNNPHIKSIYHTDHMPAPDQFDLYVNLDDAYEWNPTVHYVDNYFYRAFGNIDYDKSVELFPSAEDRAKVAADLAEIGSKYIVVHMRNWHWPSKNVDLNTWFAVYEQLFEHTTDYKVVTVGGPTDYSVKDHPLFVDRCGQYNSQQMKLLCDSAACFVGIDSGPFQCAAASSTHIVALLTHLHPDRILPYRNATKGYRCTAVQTDIDCRGCNDTQRRPVRQLDCVHGDFRCSKSFDATAIADAIIKTL